MKKIEMGSPDYVIEIDSVNGPCWVASGGGDPERTHNLQCAEVYATEFEANENMNAFRNKYPARTFTVRTKPERYNLEPFLTDEGDDDGATRRRNGIPTGRRTNEGSGNRHDLEGLLCRESDADRDAGVAEKL